jgi:hypothetical protein
LKHFNSGSYYGWTASNAHAYSTNVHAAAALPSTPTTEHGFADASTPDVVATTATGAFAPTQFDGFDAATV